MANEIRDITTNYQVIVAPTDGPEITISQPITRTIEVSSLGPRGTDGVQGTSGASGSNGSQGIQGTNGSGSQGTTGTQGIQGRQGLQGRQGITGGTGLQGTTGAGAQGTAGSSTGTGSYLTYSAIISQATGQAASASILVDDYAGNIYPFSSSPNFGAITIVGMNTVNFAKLDVQFSYFALDGTEIVAAWAEAESPFINLSTYYTSGLGLNADGALDLMTTNFFGRMVLTFKEYL